MDKLRSFVIHGEWLDTIRQLKNIELENKIIRAIIEYGVDGILPGEDENPIVMAMLKAHQGQIDFSKGKYVEKIESGKINGKQKKYSDEEIRQLAESGMSAKEIAIELGVSASTIYHSDGWKNKI